MSLCKLEIFPDETSGVYIVKLVAFTVIFAIVAACFSAGLAEVLNAAEPVPDPFLQILTTTGNFVGVAILGMAIFILPFGLGGMAFGYVIESNREKKSRTVGIGFVAGALVGFLVLFAILIPIYRSSLVVGAAFGALAGFAGGIVLSSTRFYPWDASPRE